MGISLFDDEAPRAPAPPRPALISNPSGGVPLAPRPLPQPARGEPAVARAGGELAVSRAFCDIKPQPLRWLWPGRIPLGKLTLLAGDPGLGKSLITVDIASHISTGTSFPDGAACEQGEVIILSAEDDPADTIRPRFDAAGADVSRVHLLEAVRRFAADGKSVEASFNLEGDIPALEELIGRTGARLVIIDPISAYLGSADSNTNGEIRGLLAPLSTMAAKHSTAILAVTHLRKSAGAAIHRAIGSLAFAAATRSVWGICKDPENEARRLMLSVKQNLAPESGGLAYRIEAPNGIARIAWEPGAVAGDVDEMMGGFDKREDDTEEREAEAWLRDFLAEGPAAAAEVWREVRAAGLSKTTVWRAAKSLRVEKRKLGGRGSGWEWALPGLDGENLKESSPEHFKESNPIYTNVDSLNMPLKTQGDSGSKNSKNPSMECVKPETFIEGEA